ncbi:histidinol-phosphate transaminase [Pontibacter oryzae]|uniref:Histidinol-phosphate aminotransferase n=1 Tax=Pontibacter oryzae TaxID=2304593 RepID=A0A399RW19_9BACT|nr:histidinol-phosphate transaminase [Pontibacter oryzae]RIJ34032.1 histidinol-phosphate transaminase [Pontibacter oryzae]
METSAQLHYNGSTNENLFGISAKVADALQHAITFTHTYPNPDASALSSAIAARLAVNPSQVAIGSGSAELISLLVRAICKPHPDSNIVSVMPTYPLYRLEAEALGVHYKTAPLNSKHELEIECLLQQIDEKTRIIFLANPNNPTGNYLTQPQLERLLQEVPPQVLLVLDEAYVEYTTAPDFTDGMAYLSQYPNLVVLRTFSKAYGLAALRVGYLVAQEQLVQKILTVKLPYNVNQFAQMAALAALEDQEHLNHTVSETLISKAHLQQLLDACGVQWWPSEGNFLYVDAGVPAAGVVAGLAQYGIRVREMDSKFHFRITVGTHENQQHLHEKLNDILAPAQIWPDKALAQILETGYQLPNIEDVFQGLAAVADLAETANSIGTAAERIALAFARAFSACLGPEGNEHAGNLYSSTYGETDMISAFNVLVKSTPLVTFGHLFGNLAIAKATEQSNDIHILDLGIGSGLQWLHLLDVLAARPGKAPKISITGVDIPASTGTPDARLRQAGCMLQQHAARLGLEFHYSCLAKRLEDVTLQDLYFSPTETLVVNSTFTLHHLPDKLQGEVDYRDKVLQQVKALKPAIVTLTEPDSEHNKLNFLPRLRESLRHYYTVFDALDTLLPRFMPERQVIEQEFFGREIINVISCEGSQRVERHERHEAWRQRLARNGFAPADHLIKPKDIHQALELHPNFSLQPNGAGYTLCWKGTPVVAATAWV